MARQTSIDDFSKDVNPLNLKKSEMEKLHNKIINGFQEEPKQETLEEVAEKIYNEFPLRSESLNNLAKEKFIAGAKWQQERSYSEEEVLDILIKAMKEVKVKQLTFFDGGSEYPIYSNLSKWFEQFKKEIRIMKTFFQSFFQLALVSISTILITKHLYFGIFVVGFLISLLWTFNVSRIAISTINQKLTYALGAGIGAVCGVLITQLFN